MVRRSRSIPAPSIIDREWPHQVALPDDICTDRNFTLIGCFLKERRLVCQTRSVIAIWEDGKQEQWRLYCFAQSEAAADFLSRFGGVEFDPKRDREKGRTRGVWRRHSVYERIFELGPLSMPEILRR